MPAIACPACRRQLRVPDELLGRPVQCPNCAEVFTASEAIPPAAPAPDAITPSAPAPAAEINDRDEILRSPDAEPDGIVRPEDVSSPTPLPLEPRRFEEDEDYPIRNRRGEARSLVNGPASALQVVGILAAVLSGLGLVMHIILLAANLPNDGRPPEERIVNFVGGAVSGCLGLFWGGFIFYGAGKMKKLKGYGLAMAATILAMIPCNGCCILGLPFGIWALVVLCRPEVRDAFTS